MKKILSLLCLSFLLFSCGKQEEEKKMPPSEPQSQIPAEVELKPAAFADLSNWKNDNFMEIIKGLKDSCAKIKNEKNKFLSNSVVPVPADKYKSLCREFSSKKFTNSWEVRNFFETNFTPYLVTYNGNPNGKFTSYYESSLNASHQKSEKYKYPVYGRPHDLIEFNPKDFDETLPAKRFVGRLQGKKLIPYYTRYEIENNGINAPIILWGDNPVDIYIMQIQGSAVADLDDGSQVRIGYADNNGHPFKGIGSILLEKGLIKPGEASMGKIKQWLLNNKDKAVSNMLENKRYVFHKLSEAEGPIGAQGVPLHAGRSLAVDRHYIPLGALLWLETTAPDKQKIEKLVIAQDIGGAIKGAVRGDYFWGSGKDDILDKAGRMNSEGRYFILLPKDTEINSND